MHLDNRAGETRFVCCHVKLMRVHLVPAAVNLAAVHFAVSHTNILIAQDSHQAIVNHTIPYFQPVGMVAHPGFGRIADLKALQHGVVA